MQIKSLILSLAILALTGVPLQAQKAFGFHAAATSSKIDGFDASSEAKWGFLAGARFEWITGTYLTIPIELNFVQKGGLGTVDGDAIEITNTFIEIPVYLDITYSVGQRGRIGFYSGMEFGFAVGCTVAQSGASEVDCGEGPLELKEQSFNLAWPFGVEYSHQLANGHRLGFDVRYSLGLSNAVENQLLNMKNKAWYFMGRWMLPTRL